MRSTSVFQRRTQREAHYGSIGGFIFSEYRNRKSLEGENECKRYVELEVRKVEWAGLVVTVETYVSTFFPPSHPLDHSDHKFHHPNLTQIPAKENRIGHLPLQYSRQAYMQAAYPYLLSSLILNGAVGNSAGWWCRRWGKVHAVVVYEMSPQRSQGQDCKQFRFRG